MSSRLRQAICEKLPVVLRSHKTHYALETAPRHRSRESVTPVFHYTLAKDAAGDCGGGQALKSIASQFDKNLLSEVHILESPDSDLIKLEFRVQPQAYVDFLLSTHSAHLDLMENLLPDEHRVLIEFSSPNIAKPFHVGHLRSTIIGNVLANLHSSLGYDVTKMNYLGDWGTQFGMLQVGVEMCGLTDEEMCRAPLASLYKSYVTANVAAKTNPEVSEKARRYFTDLETNSDSGIFRLWEKYRKYTIAELSTVYERLGVQFDQYDWESQYSQKQIHDVLKNLSEKGLLLDEADGRKVVEVDGRRIPIIKSDGSTLYLARDIAALVDRFQRYHFDRVLYVVENGQSDHFNACFKTTAKLCPGLGLDKLLHVKFGRIHGMNTRSGNVVFLSDVLDEARDIMLEKQLKTTTTKVELSKDTENYKETADILGVSAVIVNDLRQRRQKDYDFQWSKALQVNGDTGIKLQYTHCRLYSLLEKMSHIDIESVRANAQYLTEPEACDVLYELTRFENVLMQSKEQLEPCILINYLFALCNATSRALKHLNIKNESCRHKQENRLLLFRAAKATLNRGMRILGLKPLNQM